MLRRKTAFDLIEILRRKKNTRKHKTLYKHYFMCFKYNVLPICYIVKYVAFHIFQRFHRLRYYGLYLFVLNTKSQISPFTFKSYKLIFNTQQWQLSVSFCKIDCLLTVLCFPPTDGKKKKKPPDCLKILFNVKNHKLVHLFGPMFCVFGSLFARTMVEVSAIRGAVMVDRGG